MFDSAVIRRPGLINGQYDVGRVCETLLYYRQVHLILDVQFLSGLAAAIGIEALKDLLALPHVSADILSPEMPGVHTTRSGFNVHRPIYLRYSGQKPRSEREYLEATHEFLSNQQWAKGGLSVDAVRKALAPARVSSYSKLIGAEPKTNALFLSIAEDSATVRLLIENYARLKGAKVDASRLAQFEHELIQTDEGIIVASEGLDLLFRPSSVPADLNWASVLSSIFEYSLDLQLAGNLSSDVIVADEACELAVARIDLAVQRAIRSAEQVTAFQETVFEDAKFFSGAVNDGTLSIGEALSIIEKCGDLRKWTSGLPPTSNLVREYVDAVGAQQPLEKLGPSLLRFFGFTTPGVLMDIAGAGGLGTAIGLGLSAFDQFLLNRIARGWRPNTFVNRLKRSIQS